MKRIILALTLLLSGISVAVSVAASPKTISYQGYLKDNTGVPVTAAAKPMGFALYSSQNGTAPLWSESQNVKVDNGIYQVELGSAAPISLPFDTRYYLGVTVPPDPEMTPRQALTSAPYTFRAKLAEGVSMACTDGGVLIYKSGIWQCGTVTTLPNAAATCIGPVVLDASGCTISMCSPGWGDCNKQVPDGCEVDLKTTPANCGACGHSCTAPANMSTVCTAGVCATGACTSGYADCNNNLADGCETNTTIDLYNCGGCGKTCATVANGSRGCFSGTCGISSCNAGYLDCDGNPANGCESNSSTDPNNCGSCGHQCSAVNGTASCQGGICGIYSCNAGYVDCDGNAANGCETNTSTSTSNCGACGTACSLNNITPSCTAGICSGTCNAGFADCNGNKLTDGCETNITADTNNCGQCGHACSSGHSCVSGVCI